MNPTELRNELEQFSGTEQWHRHQIGIAKILYTDGIEHLAKKAQAFWLLDAILSYQLEPKVKNTAFQLWLLEVKDNKAILTMREDTDTPKLVEQKIDFTDFPEGTWKLYLADGVLLLPSEY